jgi:hypothetical protein
MASAHRVQQLMFVKEPRESTEGMRRLKTVSPASRSLLLHRPLSTSTPDQGKLLLRYDATRLWKRKGLDFMLGSKERPETEPQDNARMK